MDTTTITQTSDAVMVTGQTGIEAQTSVLTDVNVIRTVTTAASVASAQDYDDDSIAGFFRRPVLINTFTWTTAVTQGQQIQNMDPWYLFLTNPAVLRKTVNYYKISGTLVLDVIIQAAPTMYGHAIVQLVPQGVEMYASPYTLDTPNTVLDILPTMWQSTQDVYGDLVPATSEALEFELPWIGVQDAIELSTLSNLGPLAGGFQTQWRFLTHCIAPLSNATNVAGTGSVTVKVFARLENAKLAIPLVLQTGEKKKKKQGSVGRIAGVVSNVASVLKSVPIVGEFAAGVEVVSNAIGAVADWFGFTRVTSLVPFGRIRQEMFPGLALADGDDAGITLGLLRENKVSIDPALLGSDKTDIESFDDLFRRKTLIRVQTWATTDAPGAVLQTIPVNPMVCNIASTFAYPAPVGYVATMFNNWRGPLYYEFQIRCSTLHRGMLQVVFHPSSASSLTDDPTNVSYNRIFDISAAGVHTFKVSWASNLVAAGTGIFGVTPTGSFINGSVSIRVFAALTAPDSAASVVVETYMYSDGDMQFFVPRQPLESYVLQAGESDEASATMVAIDALVGPLQGGQPDVTAIFGGERIQSVRTLMQRPHPWYLLGYVGTPVVSTLNKQKWIIPFDLAFGSSACPPITMPPGVTRIVRTPVTFLSQMFVGWRGSIRIKASTFFTLSDTKMQLADMTIGGTTAVAPVTSSGAWTANDFDQRGEEGWGSTNNQTNGSLEVTIPYYYRRRYVLSRVTGDYTTAGPTSNGVAVILKLKAPASVTIAVGEPLVQVYMSAGEDFSVGRFRFVPRLKIS
jgi:hypothetical protein